MDDTSKYLIHATVRAEGVVERSDVVGAIFGQTEGLLGSELDLRELRESQKVGRIDVSISSAGGESTGELTIATGLDKVETATLAAALETITRVGPCRASVTVSRIEDVRAAKRTAIVERATELLESGFDDTVMSSDEILSAVREHVRTESVTTYEGLPAGPRVADSDAIIVVEGRADVITLLKYGVKNAIAVEGTNVPEAVCDLTQERTVTAFLDGDRGGELILEELSQIADIDFVAFAPVGASVEDLDHHDLFAALRNKVPFDDGEGEPTTVETIAATDGSTKPAPSRDSADSDRLDSPRFPGAESDDGALETGSHVDTNDDTRSEDTPPGSDDRSRTASDGVSEQADDSGRREEEKEVPSSIVGHVATVVDGKTDTARLLDGTDILTECSVDDAYETLAGTDHVPETIVLDGIVSQRLVDLAAARGVSLVVGRSLGQFTKRPTDVRVLTAASLERPRSAREV